MFFAGHSKIHMFKNIPIGTVRLTDSLYIDSQPIKVRDYLEFLGDIRRSYSPIYHDSINKLPVFGLPKNILYELYNSLPMDTVFYRKMVTRSWHTHNNDNFSYDIDFRLTSSRYSNYPIVNINSIQIREFCKWRSDKVKLYYASKCKTLKQRKKYPINFEYRIISHKEWEKAMGSFINSVKKLKTVDQEHEIINVAAPYTYEKNTAFYYESTNAGEYLQNDIVTVGFNWIDEAGLGDVSYMKFEKPADWITFRCICEIKTDTINVSKIKPEKIIKKKKPKKVIKDKPKEKKIKGVRSKDAKKKSWF